MSRMKVLVVEDDAVMRDTCLTLFRRAGYGVHGAANAAEALAWLDQTSDDVIVLSDVRMPGAMDGIALLDEIRARHREVDVVIMTGFGTIQNAVEAMKHGAVDYVTKPFNKDELLLTVARVVELRELRGQVQSLRQGLESKYRFDGFVAESESMRPVVEAMVAASRSPASLLLTGESGTGKDMVARLVHFEGVRATSSFVPVNCASLPAELIESELFGHRKGAYTGAGDSHPGLIRQADGGTLMLDEITEMPTSTQAKLLRVLQEKAVRPVGGTTESPIDFRLIASTNRVVADALADGFLREDLYYRIGVLQIHLPPLRERIDDIRPLFKRFLERAASAVGVESVEIDRGASQLLMQYQWPGNVRELDNVAERCVAMGARGCLSKADIEAQIEIGTVASATPGPAAGTLETAERQAVERAMESAAGNKSQAARILGISRKTLYERLRRYEQAD